jgi:hypothetical protein
MTPNMWRKTALLRFLRSAAALVLIVVAGMVVTGSAAQAATGTCPGTRIGKFNLYSDGAPINGSLLFGYVEVYYSNGYNCARTVSSSNTWGVSKTMSVELWVCATSSTCRLLSPDDRDHGTYRYYAGPVSAYARDKCIWVIGNIYYPPTDSNAGDNKYGWCD